MFPLKRAIHKRLRHAKKTANFRTPGQTVTVEQLWTIIRAQRYRCPYCHSLVHRDFHLDHIKPLSRGGSNSPGNIQFTCPRCNLTKYTADRPFIPCTYPDWPEALVDLTAPAKGW
jgi:5-methylcytosine-specific restriction endonuclease McrA